MKTLLATKALERILEQNVTIKMKNFVCDIAEIILPIFEEKYPTDSRLRVSLGKARLYIEGEIGPKELEKAWYDVYDAASESTQDYAKSVFDGVDATEDAADVADAINYVYGASKAKHNEIKFFINGIMLEAAIVSKSHLKIKEKLNALFSNA